MKSLKMISMAATAAGMISAPAVAQEVPLNTTVSTQAEGAVTSLALGATPAAAAAVGFGIVILVVAAVAGDDDSTTTTTNN